ncbi:hypothetical protein ACIRPT_00175 [Streptomyces sp. NPDC101227]|uniref:hypothetical protein n=1 Tax=Streptomyces sp. NPDC101227 TaxID=3366136 RepID=UPI003819D740
MPAAEVARSSFYAWLAAAKTRAASQATDEALAHEITVIHAELRRMGRVVNRNWVARLVREHAIQGAHRRRRRSLTRPDKKVRPAPDLIGRDSHAEQPATKLARVPFSRNTWSVPRSLAMDDVADVLGGT